jgi:hypothetical protein
MAQDVQKMLLDEFDAAMSAHREQAHDLVEIIEGRRWSGRGCGACRYESHCHYHRQEQRAQH